MTRAAATGGCFDCLSTAFNSAGWGHDPGLSVQRLVRSARLGNTRATQELYERYVARVFRAVRALSGSDEEAEDVTQDAFIDAFTNLESYEARRDTRFSAWLLTIALNRARKSRRRRGRVDVHSPGALRDIADERAAVEDPAESLVDRIALLQALAEIPSRDREVVALFYGAELTAEEVGRIVGLRAPNVRKIAQRRRNELLEHLRNRKESP